MYEGSGSGGPHVAVVSSPVWSDWCSEPADDEACLMSYDPHTASARETTSERDPEGPARTIEARATL